MSILINQTHFEWYVFDVNVVHILTEPVFINQCCNEYQWIRIVKFQYCWLIMSGEKTIHCWSLVCIAALNKLKEIIKWY